MRGLAVISYRTAAVGPVLQQSTDDILIRMGASIAVWAFLSSSQSQPLAIVFTMHSLRPRRALFIPERWMNLGQIATWR